MSVWAALRLSLICFYYQNCLAVKKSHNLTLPKKVYADNVR